MATTKITPNKHVIILGADDPEMSAIEKIATELGFQVCHMTDEFGKRVHPGNAYKGVYPYPHSTNIVFIECGYGEHGQPGVVIDHHRPGDPGFGKGPAEYWQGSSIGQFVEATGLPIVEATEIVGFNAAAVAAADHCLSAAYRGECPGVTFEEVADFRDRSRAAFLKRTLEEQRATVKAAIAVCHEAVVHDHPLLGGRVIDLTDRTSPLDEGPEAAGRLGLPMLARLPEPRTGREKFSLLGASPEQVLLFKEYWEKQGQKPYAMPDRGIAGVVIV